MAEYIIDKIAYNGDVYKLQDNQSGFVTTDEKLKTEAIISDTTYYPIVGSNSSTASTKFIDSTGFKYKGIVGTSSTSGCAALYLGNNTASGTAGNKYGQLTLYDESEYAVTIWTDALTANRNISLPDKTGTMALTSDIPDTSSFLTTETDPVFSASAAAGISATDISNWNGKSDTDEKVKTTFTHSDSYVLTGTTSGFTVTGELVASSHAVINLTSDYVTLSLEGNDSYPKQGRIALRSSTGKFMYIKSEALVSSAQTVSFPNKTGTIALTSDIPTVPTISLNGSSTTSASFYAPTTAGTSGQVLTSNGSGAPTWTAASGGTDEKLAVSQISTNGTYYPIVGTGTTAATRQFDTTGFSYTTNSIRSFITLGNNIAEGTTGSKRGAIQIYGTTDRYTQLETLITSTGTGQATGVVVNFPNKGGTIALTDDIPTVPIITLNGSSTTSPSFYAPTSAGTSGYYLKSNGSGAPTWAAAQSGSSTQIIRWTES